MGKKTKSHPKTVNQSTQKTQVAALPFRVTHTGDIEVLLLTSRETKRFILPKGWPMKKLSDRSAAAREAYEEAGVGGQLVKKKPIGSYTYFKRRLRTFEFVKVDVYPLMVTDNHEEWPEKGQRAMGWLNPADAAILVDEPQLASIIAGFAEWARQHRVSDLMAQRAELFLPAIERPGRQ